MNTSLREKILELYVLVDEQVKAFSPVCVASGRCCRFKEYGHTLFLSHLEAEVLLEAAPAYDPSGVSRDFCPFQVGNLCVAREPRPLGCRIYFCDPVYQDRMAEISEAAVRRLKELAEEHDAGWRYAPLHVFLCEETAEAVSSPAEH